MFGFRPNMTVTEAKHKGLNLVPFMRYTSPTEYGLHAFYGMDSFRVKNSEKSLKDANLVVVSFNRNNQLKLLQVESKTLKNQHNLSKINRRIEEVAKQFSRTFGDYKVAYHKDRLGQKLPLYEMKTNNLWVSITPVISNINGKVFDVNYVVKYFVQDNKL